MTADGILPDSVARLDDIFCGCGDPEIAWAWIKRYLSGLHTRAKGQGWPWKPSTGPEYLAVYVLDHLDLTEHGSTIRCPSLTNDGREVLAFLEAQGADWKDHGPWYAADGTCRALPSATEPPCS